MVWVGGGGVLEEVLDEQDVARDPLDRFDQQVVQGETAGAVL